MPSCSLTTYTPDILRAPEDWAPLYPHNLPAARRLARLGLVNLGDRLRFYATRSHPTPLRAYGLIQAGAPTARRKCR